MAEKQKQTVICHDCGKRIDRDKAISVKRFDNGKHVEAFICPECYKKGQELDTKRSEQTKKQKKFRKGDSFVEKWINGHSNKSVLIGAGITGFIVFALVFGLGIGLGLPLMPWWGWLILSIILSYALFADVYCIFIESFVSELFLDVVCFGIKIPILGIVILVLTFPIAIVISSLISIFVFPAILIKNIGED